MVTALKFRDLDFNPAHVPNLRCLFSQDKERRRQAYLTFMSRMWPSPALVS